MRTIYEQKDFKFWNKVLVSIFIYHWDFVIWRAFLLGKLAILRKNNNQSHTYTVFVSIFTWISLNILVKCALICLIMRKKSGAYYIWNLLFPPKKCKKVTCVLYSGAHYLRVNTVSQISMEGFRENGKVIAHNLLNVNEWVNLL